MSVTVFAYDASLPRVIDETGSLTKSEISTLTSESERFRSKYSMDCVLVLINSLGYKSAQDYADDYYDYNGYGMGYDNSGVLILVSIGDREVHVSTCGRAINEINDREVNMILDDVTSHLSSNDWYGGLYAFIISTGRMIERANTGGGFDSVSTGERIAIALITGLVIALAVVGTQVYKMNNARKKTLAVDYTIPGSFALTGALDIFLSRKISKTPRAESGGSGGSSHRSSSGVSHGGGGRHF